MKHFQILYSDPTAYLTFSNVRVKTTAWFCDITLNMLWQPLTWIYSIIFFINVEQLFLSKHSIKESVNFLIIGVKQRCPTIFPLSTQLWPGTHCDDKSFVVDTFVIILEKCSVMFSSMKINFRRHIFRHIKVPRRHMWRANGDRVVQRWVKALTKCSVLLITNHIYWSVS
jgi:hypothetical protein